MEGSRDTDIAQEPLKNSLKTKRLHKTAEMSEPKEIPDYRWPGTRFLYETAMQTVRELVR